MKQARYIFYFFLIFLAALVGLLPRPETQPVVSLHTEGSVQDIIVIDAGHGGFDGGAIGRFTKVKEAVLNLAVAKKLQKLFVDNGDNVIMTREDDEAVASTKEGDMWTRRRIIDESSADIVISIHMNKFKDSSVAGPLAFYFEKSTEGEKLAELIQTELNAELGPVRPRGHRPERYYILRSGDAPCVLVECGFISNEREEWLLQNDDYQQKCADAIFRGARQYLEQRFVTDVREDIAQ